MKRVKVRGIEMAYSDRGSGTPVLCVHGFPLTHALWSPIAERLDRRARWLMPDLRGFGRSGVTSTATMSDYADDLAALLDAIGVNEKVVVLGLSMGGYVVLEFFRRHPGRVAALVLADTRADADTPAKKEERTASAERALNEGVQFIVDGMTPNLFAPDASKSLVDEWRGIMSASDPRGVSAALVAMRDRADSVPMLKEIRVPTLVIVGEKDAITPPDAARVISNGIPGATLEVIPGVGHMTPVESPDKFAAAVERFLHRIDHRSAS